MLNNRHSSFRLFALSLALLFCLIASAYAQGMAFTYQGRLTDSTNPATGTFDMQFKLFDTGTVGTGAQQGGTITNSMVQVTNGTFSVELDFAPCASCFDGSARFLEIAIRPAGSMGAYTVLAPRQPITSAPYAMQAANAGQLGGIAASGFIQNTTMQQAMANLNISGNGTAGGTLSGNIVNAVTQYNLNGLRAFTINGAFSNGITVFTASNTFTGEGAGLNTTPSPTLINPSGKFNSFYGAGAGQANTTGSNNAFFGARAGELNSSGNSNAFFGNQAGFANTTGAQNAIFGSSAGISNTTGSSNAFFGRSAGFVNTTGFNNAFFGTSAGISNTSGFGNTLIGTAANFTDTNTNGNQNTLLGHFSSLTTNLTNATAIGARASVTQSNSLVLGAIFNVNGCSAPDCNSVNVGIGTTAPSQRLHVVGNGLLAGMLEVRAGSDTQTGPVEAIRIGGPNTPADANSAQDLKWAFASAGSAGVRAYRGESWDTYLQFLTNSLFQGGDAPQVRMHITHDGNVGIGTTFPADRLQVTGDIRVGSGVTGCVRDANGSVIAGTCSSDARLKRDVTPFAHLLDKVTQLQPVQFYWRSEQYKERYFGAKPSFGLIAQEVEKVLPELVTEDEQGFKAVNYSKLPVLMLQAVRELRSEKDEEVAALRAENDALRQQLKQQEERLRRLEAAMSKVTGKD